MSSNTLTCLASLALMVFPALLSAQTISGIALLEPIPNRTTNRSMLTVVFELRDMPAPVRVQFTRRLGGVVEGATDTLSGLPNGSNTMTLILLDIGGGPGQREGVPVSWDVTVTPSDDPDASPITVLTGQLPIVFDDSPPAEPSVTAPSLPGPISGTSFTLEGSLKDRSSGVAMRSGRVEIHQGTARGGGPLIGAGDIRPGAPGRFSAGVTIGWLAPGEYGTMLVTGVDDAGNRGAPLVLEVLRTPTGLRLLAR